MAKITKAKAALETEAEAEEPAPKRLGRKPRARSRVPRPKAQRKFLSPEFRQFLRRGLDKAKHQ